MDKNFIKIWVHTYNKLCDTFLYKISVEFFGKYFLVSHYFRTPTSTKLDNHILQFYNLKCTYKIKP